MSIDKIIKEFSFLCLISVALLLSGCSLPWDGQDKGLDAGYYKRVYLLPHGQFVGIEKISSDAARQGVVYKVELDDMKRVKEVAAVYNDKPIDVGWGLDIINTASRFAKIVINYDGNDNMTYEFRSANDEHISWQIDVAAIRYTNMNKEGLPGKAEYLTSDMTPVFSNGQNLVAEFSYDHDTLETIKLSGWLNSGDALQLKFYYDKNFLMHKLPTGMECMDTDGKLYPFIGDVARIIWQYDKHNRLIKKQLFGADGEPANGNIGIYTLLFDPLRGNYERFASYFTCTYDENQYSPGKVTFYNTDGELWKSKSNASIVHQPIYQFNYNEAGDLTKVETKDENGNATELRAGVYSQSYAYDDVGNLKELTYCNADGQPVLIGAKYAKFRQVHDTHRRVIETSFYGVNDEKVNAALKDNGKLHYYHKRVIERNNDGSPNYISYYNANGKQTK